MPAVVKCPKCGDTFLALQLSCKQCHGPLDSNDPRPENAIYDRIDHFRMIVNALLPGEELEAVFDMESDDTGFIGITTKRVIIYDKAFLPKIKATVSIPYSRIESVAVDDERGVFTYGGAFASNRLIVTTAHSDHAFEFHGTEKAHVAHNLILTHMLE